MMASSKLATSSRRSRNSDLSRRPSSNSSATKPKPTTTTTTTTSFAAAGNLQIQNLNNNSGFNYRYGTNTTSSQLQFGSMTLDSLMGDSNSAPMTDATLLGAQITLLDNALAAAADINLPSASPPSSRTVDEVWQDIVSGRTPKQTKEEAPEEGMTLEDFLARAGAVDEHDIKGFAPPPPQTTETERLSGGELFSYDQISTLSPFGSIDKVEGSITAFGNGGEVVGSGGSGGGSGRGKRGRVVLEPLDKAAQQRQRRMIKNRESAARSRERKQAYQSELESLAVRLEEENEQLLKEQAERTEERRKQLMETVIPVVEKRRPSRALRRVRSLQW